MSLSVPFGAALFASGESRRGELRRLRRRHASVADGPGGAPLPAGRQWLVLAAIGVFVAAAVIAAHWPALGAKALCIDDVEYLTENPLVQNPSWDSAGRFLSEVSNPSSVKGYYQPLNMISLMLDCAMGGSPGNLAVFHRTSLAFHVANTLLVMVLLFLLFGDAWSAGAVALLFGVHPMTVETIPWIGERKTLLAAFFSLVAFVLYVLHARRGGWKWLAGCAAAYVLAVLSKPTATPLPAAMLVMDYWPLRRLSWRASLEKVPLFAVAVASAAVTYISQSKLAAERRPPLDALLIFCHNVVFYPFKMLWPAGLSSHYPYPDPLALSNPPVLVGVIGTVVLAAALGASLLRTRAVASAWAIFLVLIFPTMGVIGFSNAIASDKYAYLPVVGLLVLLAFLAHRLLASVRQTAGAPPLPSDPSWSYASSAVSSSSSSPRLVLLAVLTLTLAAFETTLTRRYLADWQDTIHLYRHMLACSPETAMLHNNYGRFVELRGNELFEQAQQEMAAARSLAARGRPAQPEAQAAAAAAREALACFREARVHFEEAVRRSVPREQRTTGQTLRQSAELCMYDDALVNLGKSIFLDAQRAAYAAAAAAAADPSKAGAVRAAEQQYEAALREAEWYFRRAVQVSGGRDYAASSNLAVIALNFHGDANESVRFARQALAVNPIYVEGMLNLALALDARGGPGDLDEAHRLLQTARRYHPGDGRVAAALEDFEKRRGLPPGR